MCSTRVGKIQQTHNLPFLEVFPSISHLSGAEPHLWATLLDEPICFFGSPSLCLRCFWLF